MDKQSMPVSNMESMAHSSFGTAGPPPQNSPEKMAPKMVAAPGKTTEAAPAGGAILDAWWASFGDAATRAKMRQEAMKVIVHPTDQRQQVGNLTDYPWRCIASLRITANDGSSWIGTGWLVNRRVLLTAGHCVYMADQGGWVKQIEVIPGRNADNFPYGSCIATAFRSVQGWTTDRNRDYDYGAILLPDNCAYGDQLGWFGYQVRDDDNLKTLTINISGYPGDKPDGTQWYESGAVKNVANFEFEYDIDTTGGQSGSPVWISQDDGSRYGVGVHTNGAANGNSATRITQEVCDNVAGWVKEAP